MKKMIVAHKYMIDCLYMNKISVFNCAVFLPINKDEIANLA